MPSLERERSQTTKNALMRAAEQLIAQQGIENVAIKDIVIHAKQRNESALQYHFNSINGLIAAIHQQRGQQIQERRAELLVHLLEETDTPDLASVCLLMIKPAFDLARANASFACYVQAFGHELALTDGSTLAHARETHGAGGSSAQQLGELLVGNLPHLDNPALLRRMDAAVRLCAASMYHQSRHRNAFKGIQADLFLHNLKDALVGLFSAPESAQTKALAAKHASS